MAISIKHKFTSPKADGSDASLIRPSNWNEEHTITLAASRLLGRHTATNGPVEEVALGSGLSLSGGQLQVDVVTKSAADTAAATIKAAPVDADSVLLSDSTASNGPKKLTWANLKAALNALYAPAGRTITADGLATGGGGLSANLTITVTKSTKAQAEAGTDDATAMTPVRTNDAITKAFAVSVYTGSSANNLDYPVGTHIIVSSGNTNRNATALIYLSSTNAFQLSASGTALSGTWRARGLKGGTVDVTLFQRTA